MEKIQSISSDLLLAHDMRVCMLYVECGSLIALPDMLIPIRVEWMNGKKRISPAKKKTVVATHHRCVVATNWIRDRNAESKLYKATPSMCATAITQAKPSQANSCSIRSAKPNTQTFDRAHAFFWWEEMAI